jgi:hypothetical protein
MKIVSLAQNSVQENHYELFYAEIIKHRQNYYYSSKIIISTVHHQRKQFFHS